MPHTVTNIEGFEIQDTPTWTFNFGGAASGGVFVNIGGGFQRSGNFAALQQNQGWCRLPVGFQPDGAPYGGGLTLFDACIARVYLYLFGAPGATTRVATFGRNILGPTYVATVEVDVLRQLSVNGFKSGAPTTLNVGQWYRLELKCDRTAIRAELLIDGVVEYTFIGPSIGPTDFLQLGDERAGANVFCLYDDVLIESHRTNGNMVDYPGAGNVQRLLPVANGTDNAWTGVGDPVNKYLNVDETFPNDADYVQSAGISDQTFGLANLGTLANPVVPVNHVVRGVRVANRTQLAAGLPSWRATRMRSGVTVSETNVTNLAAGAASTKKAGVWQNDPNTGTVWTNAAVDAMETGAGQDNAAPAAGRVTLQETVIEHGEPFLAGRARINPEVLGGPLHMINAPEVGG